MKRILLAVISLCCCLLTKTAQSQTSIPFRSPTSDSVSLVFIKKADNYKYEKRDSATELIFLVGHVELQQEKTLIYCDSMVLNQKENYIESFGNVHINDNDSVNIYAEYMKYLVDKKLVLFQKKVKLTDGKGILTTEELHYDMNQRIGTYNSGGKVVNNGSVLTSKQGVYYAETRDVYFKNNVILRDPQYDLATDSLLYNTQTQISTFITWTDIVFRDTSHRTVRTREGFYDLRNKKAQFGKRATVTDGSQKITANDMTVDDSTKISIATGNAVYKDTAQGVVILANRLESDSKKQTLLATQNPLAILKQDQDSIYVTGDTLFSGMLSDWEKAQSARPDTLTEKRISDSIFSKKRADSLLFLSNKDSLLEGGHPILDTLSSPRIPADLLVTSKELTASILASKKEVDSVLATRHVADSLLSKAGYRTGSVTPKPESPRAKRKMEALKARQLVDSLAAAHRKEIQLAKRITDSVAAKRVTDSVLAKREMEALIAKKIRDSLSAIHTADSLLSKKRADSILSKNTFDSVLAKLVTRKPPLPLQSDSLLAKKLTDSLLDKWSRDSLAALAKRAHAASIGLDNNYNDNEVDPADSNKRFLQVYHHVRIFSDSLQAICDSLWYSGKDSIFRLFTNPIVWGNGGYQITGDTIFLFTKNNKADRLYVFENALAINKAEVNLYNQLKGITLNGYFKNGVIDYMRAKGNAESIYYTRDDNQAFVGVNRATADIIDMIWRNKQLNRVVLRNDVAGTMYPIRKVNFDEMRLRNFKWLDNKRPKTKFELFESPVPDTSRQESDSSRQALDSGQHRLDTLLQKPDTIRPAPKPEIPDPNPHKTDPNAPIAELDKPALRKKLGFL